MRKSFNLTLVATLTFSFGAAPAFASTHSEQNFSGQNNFASVAPQSMATLQTANGSVPNDVDKLLDLTMIVSGPPATFDVNAAIAAAEAELGTSRPTGWNMPGECIMSAQRWITAGGGAWVGSGNPVDNYQGATRLPFHLAEPGDIIQYEHIEAPYAWVSGVHTVLVTAVHEDGTVDIIQSNAPAGSGLVGKETNWVPQPPEGFQAVVWRF